MKNNRLIFPMMFLFAVSQFYNISAETREISIYNDRDCGANQQLISEVFWASGGEKYLYLEMNEKFIKEPDSVRFKKGKYSPYEFLKIMYPEARILENESGFVVLDPPQDDTDYPFTKAIDVPKTDDIIKWLYRNAILKYRVEFSTWSEKIPYEGGKTTLRDLLIYVADKHPKYKICKVLPRKSYIEETRKRIKKIYGEDVPEGQLYWAYFSEPYYDGLRFPLPAPLDGLTLLKVSLEVSVNEKENERDNFFVNFPVTVENISGQELFFKDFQKDGIRISNGWDFSRKISQKSDTNWSFSDLVNKNVEFKEPMPDSFSLKPGQKITILLRERRDLTKPVPQIFKGENKDKLKKREICFNELYNAVLYFYDTKGVRYESHAEKNIEFINTYYVDKNGD